MKFAYFGDNYLSDCLFTYRLENWDCICIQEEINEEFQPLKKELIHYDRLWGSYFDGETLDKKQIVDTYVYSQIKKTCAGIISKLDSPLMVARFWPKLD